MLYCLSNESRKLQIFFFFFLYPRRIKIRKRRQKRTGGNPVQGMKVVKRDEPNLEFRSIQRILELYSCLSNGSSRSCNNGRPLLQGFINVICLTSVTSNQSSPFLRTVLTSRIEPGSRPYFASSIVPQLSFSDILNLLYIFHTPKKEKKKYFYEKYFILYILRCSRIVNFSSL